MAKVSEKEPTVDCLPVFGCKSDPVKKPLETKETLTKEDGSDDNYGSSEKFVKLNGDPESEYPRSKLTKLNRIGQGAKQEFERES